MWQSFKAYLNELYLIDKIKNFLGFIQTSKKTGSEVKESLFIKLEGF